MNRKGYLTDFFDGVAVKRLSAVEASLEKSNQHEFNASTPLRKLLGESDRQQFQTRFLWLAQEEEDRQSCDGFLTLYQSRKPPRSEYRVYFPSNAVMHEAEEGDFIFICRQKDGSLLLILCPCDSTYANQLLWLFDLEDPGGQFHFHDLFAEAPPELGFTARHILEEIGIETDQGKDEFLGDILEKFGPVFPPTKEFSLFARQTLRDVSAIDDPDHALMAWMNHEELMFRSLERHIVSGRLRHGFDGSNGPDVDAFIGFSLSVQNRRKSRVGHALENHLEAIFQANHVVFERGALTEGRSKPDFLFPGTAAYHDTYFPDEKLFMLGAKTTCKDRWRQVLAEAHRIQKKHLLTLEPGISEHQTDEMQAHGLQLVLPEELHYTCTLPQRRWLWNLREFISLAAQGLNL